VFEVNVTDRAFVPSLVTVEPGRRIRYRVQAGGDLNHMLQVDVDGYDPSPLLRPGMNWILDTSRLPIGTTSLRDEVTCMKGTIVLLESPSLSNPGKGGAQGGGDGRGDDENADGEVAVQVPQGKERAEDESDEEDAGSELGGLEYRLVLECRDEAHQRELLERFEAEGLKCRALMS
jgi:hypothetical protein